MGNIGGPEILVVLIIALLVLGPNRLPQAARQMGKAMAEFRKMTSGLQAEVRDAMSTLEHEVTGANDAKPPTPPSPWPQMDSPDPPPAAYEFPATTQPLEPIDADPPIAADPPADPEPATRLEAPADAEPLTTFDAPVQSAAPPQPEASPPAERE